MGARGDGGREEEEGRKGEGRKEGRSRCVQLDELCNRVTMGDDSQNYYAT